MSGNIGHTLYAELALREAVRQKHRWAGVMQAHRAIPESASATSLPPSARVILEAD